MNMPTKGFDNSAPVQTDEEIEAQVFLELEAAHEAMRKTENSSVILFQYPDNRTVFQRLRAWWIVRQQRSMFEVTLDHTMWVSEPEWPRHWATTKYL